MGGAGRLQLRGGVSGRWLLGGGVSSTLGGAGGVVGGADKGRISGGGLLLHELKERGRTNS